MSPLKNELKEKLTIVILCAGEGKRLNKLTKDIPKPLLKVKILEDENILQNTIFKLVKLGIERIVIIIGHLGAKIEDFILKLVKNNISLQNKLLIINSENQYKFGPLYSFLSLTKNKSVYKDNNYYLLIPGDTIFDFNLLKTIISLISRNYESSQKNPFVFYQKLEQNRLRDIHKGRKVITTAEIDTIGSEIRLKRITQSLIQDIRFEANINEIVPAFLLSYEIVNEIINLIENVPFNTVWETLNYLIFNKIQVNAFNIKSRYQFIDIDVKDDLKKKEKDNRCSD